MNIRNHINSAIKILKKNNIKNPILDAEILLSVILKENREYIILNETNKINKILTKKFYELIHRRKLGEPISYIIKTKNFWKYNFYVDENVLIPRPDSEHLVEEVLKLTKICSKKQILDIGTGSGCLLLSILKERKLLNGHGIDVSKKSINVCKINAKRLDIENRAKFYISNIDKFFIGKYDIIISNPPYIVSSKLKYLEKDVYKFEPRLALDGGIDGFSEIIKVVGKTKYLLKKNGLFILEIGFKQKDKVIKLLKKKGFYIKKIIKDYAGIDRCIISYKI
tara:strand:+ start:300 stop:1142 length:843 start_codon:yes stop_codon:yes gene_type:complete